MAQYPELRGRVAVVTGAAGGIGAAFASALAAQGVKVVIADLNLAGAERVAGEIQNTGGVCQAMHVDVTKGSEVSAMVSAVLDRMGQIDILVNNAGGYGSLMFTRDILEEDWDAALSLNLKSVFLCCKYVIGHMMERRRGRIVNISSLAGRNPMMVTASHYAAAKAGVLNFTRHLAREVGSYGITVNAIAPGTTATPRAQQLRTEDQQKQLLEMTPLGRFAEPEDHAAALLFLVSDGAAYITGATIDVNGGRVML